MDCDICFPTSSLFDYPVVLMYDRLLGFFITWQDRVFAHKFKTFPVAECLCKVRRLVVASGLLFLFPLVPCRFRLVIHYGYCWVWLFAIHFVIIFVFVVNDLSYFRNCNAAYKLTSTWVVPLVHFLYTRGNFVPVVGFEHGHCGSEFFEGYSHILTRSFWENVLSPILTDDIRGFLV